MISVQREPDNLFFEEPAEDCSFACGSEGRFWHEETNLPFCEPCAKEKTLDDLVVQEKSNKKTSFHDFNF